MWRDLWPSLYELESQVNLLKFSLMYGLITCPSDPRHLAEEVSQLNYRDEKISVGKKILHSPFGIKVLEKKFSFRTWHLDKTHENVTAKRFF